MIEHSALRRSFARIRFGARILAAVVDAGAGRRTIGVGAASYQHAADVRVAGETGGTLADGTVVRGVAGGLGAAAGFVGRTSRDALFVDAGVLRGAFVVGATADSGTLDFGVAFVALAARADWFVVLYAAVGVLAAGARVLADVVYAGSEREFIML